MTAPDIATGGLTRLQLACMQVIQELTDAGAGVSPAYSDLARELGLTSRSSVHRVICGLEERGFIARLPHRARAITIRRRVAMPDFATPTFILSDALPGALAVSPSGARA